MFTLWRQDAVRLGVRIWGGIFGHEDSKNCAPRLGFALDDAAMVADDLGYQREAKA